MLGGTKGHTYLTNLHLKAAGLFKDAWPFATIGPERVNQKLSDEKLNSQKLIWFYPLFIYNHMCT